MKKLAEIISAEIDEGDEFTLFVWEQKGVHFISSVDDLDITELLISWLEARQGEEETRH